MQQYGHSTGSLTVEYKCDLCHDMGWIETDPVTRSVKKCSCLLAREAEERMMKSGLKDALELQTFDTFVQNTETQMKMYALAKQYLEDLFADTQNPRRPWLYIGGNAGSGKTHICTAVCGELLKRNIGVRYMQWLDVSRRLKAAVNEEDFED